MQNGKWKIILALVVFTLTLVLSLTLYPGGNQENKQAVGFSWMHNYWCNLMNEEAMNGMPNPARPFAIAAWVMLCGLLTLFFIRFSRQSVLGKGWRQLIAVTGVGAMLAALWLFTSWHDEATIIASILGGMALVGVIYDRVLRKQQSDLYIGGLCIALIAANNYIYYTGSGLYYLPLIQKITFVAILGWLYTIRGRR